MKHSPKILIVGRTAWTKNESTLNNIFNSYDSDSLSYICIETQLPDTDRCRCFFQISEIALIKKLFRRSEQTGFKLINPNKSDKISNLNLKKEQSLLSFVRRYRLILFSFLRELLWSFNGWKTEELDDFIVETNPDCVFFVGDPLPLMNKLQNYIVEKAQKPACVFLMDDIYTYKSSNGILKKIYKSMLRKHSGRMIRNCKLHFAISPKMKKEYDEIFGIDSILLTKGIDFDSVTFEPKNVTTPIKMVYMGKLIYGRDNTLFSIVEAIKKINKSGVKIQLYIYTTDLLNRATKKKLEIENSSFLMEPVAYSEVEKTLKEYDLVLFVESFVKKYRNTAYLSFSTKVVDYLASSRAIVAVGPADSAPIVYLEENDAAIIVSEITKLEEKLRFITNNPDIVSEYALKGFQIGEKNHDIARLNDLLLTSLQTLFNK